MSDNTPANKVTIPLEGAEKEIFNAFIHSPIGIYISQDNRFVYFNPKFQEITGFSSEELYQMEPVTFIILEDRKDARQKAIRMLKGERKDAFQYRGRNKSGHMRWITETVSSITYQGKPAVFGNFMDISEAEGLKSSFMNSPIGNYVIQNNRFVYFNPRFQEITGFPEEELKVIDPLDFVVPEDRAKVKKNAVQMLKGNKKGTYQYRGRDKSGRIRWILESVASIQYGGSQAVFGNFMDITQQKEMETAVKESEQKYRSIFESAQEGIVIINFSDGQIIEFNKEFLNMTGYDADGLLKKKIWEIQPLEFQDESRQSYFRFREQCGGLASWNILEQHNQKVIPIETIAQVMVIDGRDVIQCMVRDISERETLTRALSMASEEWRKSFDAIDDVVLLINSDFKIQRANLATARMLDMDPRSLLGKSCYTLFHGTDEPPAYCPNLKARAQGLYCQEEQEEPHLGKRLQISASPMKDENGNVVSTVEIICDVTDRRQNERESERLSGALAQSFKGITESLSDLAESRDPYTAGHSKHVAKLAQKIGNEMGFTGEDLQGLGICAILHDIGKSIIPAAILNKPGRLSEHEWGLLKAHPTTAYESLKHIPFPWPVATVVHQHHELLDGSGYPLGLKGSQIHMWARILAVADLMDAMTSHRPYRPSLPRQNAIDVLLNGRGRHYDPLVVDSIIRVMSVGDRRIIVVESEESIREGIMAVLREEGFDAIGYDSAVSALHVFSQSPFPIAIVEADLPEIDGYRLTQKMKEIHPSSQVIVISKQFDKESTLKALRAGVDDVFEKPIDLITFCKGVNRAMQRFGCKVV